MNSGENTGLRAVTGQSVRPAINIADFNKRNAEAYFPHVSELLAHTAEIDFLVPGAIPRGNIVLMSGAPFSGKTWAAYSLAYAVASGTPWLGRGAPAVQGTVAICNYDQPTETMGVRIRDVGITADMPVHVHTFGLTKPPGANMPEMLMLPAHESRLKSVFEHLKPVLIIVDSLRQSNNLDENSNKDMAALMATFKRWQRFNNTTVVLIHHTTKSGSEGSTYKSAARGSGEISASSDVELTIENESIAWTKSRSWNIGDTKKCTFALVDEFSDTPDDDEVEEQEIEIIKHVRMKALTPIPGELEALGIKLLIEGMKRLNANGVAQYKDIRAVCRDLDDTAFKKALRNARIKKAVRFVKTPRGRGYVLSASVS
jgi:hypothetical protein